MTLRILIVDDEPLARNELTYLLKRNEEVGTVEEADSIESTLERLLRQSFDLIFLDIHLTNESGLDLAEKINRMPNPPLIIFATAYDDYAIQAFERNARDYVLKPFEEERVKQAVKRAAESLKSTASSLSESEIEDRTVPIQAEERIFMVKLTHILALEVNQGETTIYGKLREYTVPDSLASWEEKLNSPFFMRVHRSYVVNINEIVEIQPWFNQTYQLTLSNGLNVPVSRSYMKAFKEKMNLLN